MHHIDIDSRNNILAFKRPDGSMFGVCDPHHGQICEWKSKADNRHARTEKKELVSVKYGVSYPLIAYSGTIFKDNRTVIIANLANPEHG